MRSAWSPLDAETLKTIFKIRMYVCLCEAVSDHQIREAIENGASSVGEVMRCTRAGTRCGSCRTEIAPSIDEFDAAFAPTAAAA